MNIEKTTFFIWLIWYFYTYGPPLVIHYFITSSFFLLNEVFNGINEIMYDDFSTISSEVENNEEPKYQEKYEDKYLHIIRKLNKDWQFTEDEIKIKNNLTIDFLVGSVENIRNKITEIESNIFEINQEIKNDTDNIRYTENYDEDGDELIEETTYEERNEYRKEQINLLLEEKNNLNQQLETEDEFNKLKTDAQSRSNNYIINNRIDKLKNCHVIEKTPQGNVLMLYDKDRETFKYYSDSTIPYRYLEVVARKYVKIFNCRPIFVDMEEELKLVEAKWTKEYELKKSKETEERLKNINAEKTKPKKNIFAKFKSYNKDACGKISMAAPPKNSIPKNTIETKEDEKVLLKERANRYTYEGKFANFNFLQKPERKIFNKKLGLSFADFKKMKNL